MNELTSISVSGFKSIRNLKDLPIRSQNLLIGPNGAGKSNFISLFRMLGWMTNSPGELQTFVGRIGGGSGLLFDGPAVTPQIEATFRFVTEAGENEYSFRLFHAAGDSLIFADERFRFSRNSFPTRADWRSLGAGHKESKLREIADVDDTARTILWLLRQCKVYQFHNTSETARIRQKWDEEDGTYLREDGGNLAPFLLRLQRHHSQAYRRIIETIGQIVPFFADFHFQSEYGRLLLQWRERESDVIFGAHQASDGTLRTMAIVSLLLQPIDNLPTIVILDEPELGLHPHALHIVAGLIRAASVHKQVILATQSTALLNQFNPEEVIVVDRQGRESEFRRLEPEKLTSWLEDYSLAELWEKNVIGGGVVR